MDNPTIQDLQTLVITARSAFINNTVICAGGAPRDILNHAPVKDIDLFVGMDADAFEFRPNADGLGNNRELSAFETAACRLAQTLGAEIKVKGHTDEYPNLCDMAVLTMPAGPFAGRVIEVIGLAETDPVDDVHSYDFDLSQVFVTPRGWFGTDAYFAAQAAREISYIAKNATDQQVLRSKARFDRLKAKYLGRGWNVASNGLLFASFQAEDRIAETKEKAALSAAGAVSDSEGWELS